MNWMANLLNKNEVRLTLFYLFDIYSFEVFGLNILIIVAILTNILLIFALVWKILIIKKGRSVFWLYVLLLFQMAFSCKIIDNLVLFFKEKLKWVLGQSTVFVSNDLNDEHFIIDGLVMIIMFIINMNQKHIGIAIWSYSDTVQIA